MMTNHVNIGQIFSRIIHYATTNKLHISRKYKNTTHKTTIYQKHNNQQFIRPPNINNYRLLLIHNNYSIKRTGASNQAIPFQGFLVVSCGI